jgi:hypothetical protein
MVHVLRRKWPFRVLALLTTFLLGLQTGRMLPEPSWVGQTPSGRTTVVLKKISDSLLPGEAHAAEAPAGLVRKKLPPAPGPSGEPAATTPAAETPGTVAGPQAAAPGPVVKTLPEPPAVIVAPADIKAPEEKPAEVAAAASPPTVPAVAPASTPAIAAPAAEPSTPAAVAPVTAPARPAVAPPAAKAPAAGARNPFSLLLASCQDKRNAEAALASYRRLGLEPYIVLTDLGPKGVWWRTLCGAYPTLEAAAGAKQGKSLAHAVVVRTPYAALIGEYVSDSEAVQAAAALARKGLFPYLVKGSASVQLMAGAFPAQSAADDYRRELEALGITSRTIQR